MLAEQTDKQREVKRLKADLANAHKNIKSLQDQGFGRGEKRDANRKPAGRRADRQRSSGVVFDANDFHDEDDNW
eukprot:3933924-Rhodomonas_salina.1